MSNCKSSSTFGDEPIQSYSKLKALFPRLRGHSKGRGVKACILIFFNVSHIQNMTTVVSCSAMQWTITELLLFKKILHYYITVFFNLENDQHFKVLIRGGGEGYEN